MAELAPIALFVYNRPEHTRLTIDALLRNSLASQSELFVFSDAAKSSLHEPAVAEVREFIHRISGFKTVTIVERNENWGLAKSIIDGVTGLCNEYERVIVLEDDLVVSPHFLDFMNVSLLKYEAEERVMQIAGYMFPANLVMRTDALFLPFISSWGWATWKRAWVHFDASAANYALLKNDAQMIHRFNLNGNYNYFRMLASQQNGKTESWAIRWYLSVFFQDGLVLYPKRTLVENTGFDGSGENCIVSSISTERLDCEFKVEDLPENIRISEQFGRVMSVLPQPKPRFLSLISYMKRLIFGWLRH